MPTRVGIDSDWVEVSAGWMHTCARRADGSVWCTGANDAEAPLGVGDTDRRKEMTAIVAPSTAR